MIQYMSNNHIEKELMKLDLINLTQLLRSYFDKFPLYNTIVTLYNNTSIITSDIIIILENQCLYSQMGKDLLDVKFLI